MKLLCPENVWKEPCRALCSAAAGGIGFSIPGEQIIALSVLRLPPETWRAVTPRYLLLLFQSSAVKLFNTLLCLLLSLACFPLSLIDLGEQQACEGADENVMDGKRQQDHWQGKICQVLGLAGDAAGIFQKGDLFEDGSDRVTETS